MLPHLSKSQARRDPADFSRSIDWAVRWLLLIGLPATLGLILLAEPLMYTLFQYDQFTPDDARMAARSLMGYGIGLTGFLGVKILVPGFSAREDLLTPARFGVYAVIVNLALSVLFALRLAPEGWAHAGLALAASLASLVNAGLLLGALYRRRVYRPEPGFPAFLLQVLLANAVMGGLLLFTTESAGWGGWEAHARVLQLTLLISLGMGAYAATLALAGMRVRHLLLPHGA
jgi:putative peptidoglycan lipid II flippase